MLNPIKTSRFSKYQHYYQTTLFTHPTPFAPQEVVSFNGDVLDFLVYFLRYTAVLFRPLLRFTEGVWTLCQTATTKNYLFLNLFTKNKHLQILNQFLNHYLSQFNSLYERKSLTLSFGSHPHNHHLQETSNVTFNLKKIIISTWKIYYWLFSKCILYFYVHGYKHNYFNHINIHLLKIHNHLIFTYKHWNFKKFIILWINH